MAPNPDLYVSLIYWKCRASTRFILSSAANCSLTFLILSFKLALKLNTLIVHLLKILLTIHITNTQLISSL